MDNEPPPLSNAALLACTHRIREDIRVIGAIAEVLQLLEGMPGPVRLEPDCLGVLGKLIVDRASGILEAVEEIRSSLGAEG